jgi:hypothetical protein
VAGALRRWRRRDVAHGGVDVRVAEAAIRVEIMEEVNVVCAEIMEEADVVRAEEIVVKFDVRAVETRVRD